MAKIRADLEAGDKYKFDSVERIESQLVAGTNNKFVFVYKQIQNPEITKRYEVIVFS